MDTTTELQRLTDLATVLEHQRNAMTNQLAHAEVHILKLRRELEALRDPPATSETPTTD